MYADEAETGISLRECGGKLIFVYGGYRPGDCKSAFDDMKKHIRLYYPKASVKYEWAAQDCMTVDGIPYIGKYSESVPYMYVATGFNKWGITSSMAAAIIISDLIIGKKNKYAEVFSPQRNVNLKGVVSNGAQYAKNLVMPFPKRCPHLGCALKWNEYEQSWDCPCHGSRFDKEGRIIDNPATKKIK